MPAKGTAQARAAMTNQYLLEISGLIQIFFTRVGEIDSQLILTELPDKTMQTTGQVSPGEFEADQLMHHRAEVAALEAFHQLSRNGAPGGKSQAILHHLGADGISVKLSQLLPGLLIKGRKTPELNHGDDGESVKITWMFSYDDVIWL